MATKPLCLSCSAAESRKVPHTVRCQSKGHAEGTTREIGRSWDDLGHAQSITTIQQTPRAGWSFNGRYQPHGRRWVTRPHYEPPKPKETPP